MDDLNVLSTLPVQTMPFVGRGEELAEIRARLENPGCRLLTLVGPGGVGKTRLALEIASRHNSPDGVHFVALQPLQSAQMVVSAIADALRLTFYSHADPQTQLFDYLYEKRLLLVLDSFEHLLDGATLVSDLLENAPGVKALVTSREALNLQEEWRYPVKGLSFPLSDLTPDITGYESVEFFLQRARRAQPDFDLDTERPYVIRLCRMTEGMPLALEMAASWVKALSCEQIVGEMRRSLDFLATTARNVPERHRSMRAVVNHSWALLSEDERQVFERLSVFRGGFERAAAEQVAGATLSILAALVEKSLLHKRPSGRYDIHELLAQFGKEQLEQSGYAEAIHSAHSGYYLRLVAERSHDLKSHGQLSALREIEADFENVRAAWEWAIQKRDGQRILPALDSLAYFYELQCRYTQAEDLFRTAAEMFEAEAGVQCGLLARQGIFCSWLGQYAKACDLLERSIVLARQANMPDEVIHSMKHLGKARCFLGEYEQARQITYETLAIYEGTSDEYGMASCIHLLGYISVRQGDFEEAQRLYEDSAASYRQLGDQRQLADVLANLGTAVYTLGDYVEARQILEESLAVFRALDFRFGIAKALNQLGVIYFWGFKDYVEAKRLYEQSLAIRREIGDRSGLSFTLNNLGDLAFRLEAYEEARRYYQECLAVKRQIGDPWGVSLALAGLGDVTRAAGQYDESQRCCQEALKIAIEIRAMALVLGIFVSTAELLRRMSRLDDSAALFTLVVHYPFDAKETKDVARNLLSEIEPALSPSTAGALHDKRLAGTLVSRHVRSLAEFCGVAAEYMAALVSAWNGAAPTALPTLDEPLTSRELEVLQLIAEGLSNQQIADALVIGAGTAKTHTLNIYRKLDVNSRTQAIARARELGLIPQF